MEDENEVLDWGNEDDEQQNQDFLKKGSAADDVRRSSGDVEDAEDSVSLGEDEDEQDYYAYQHNDSNGAAPPSRPNTTPKSATQNTTQPQSQSSRELKRENSSTSQVHSSNAGSPQRNQPSASQQSPQRSHSFSATRITHALPPKPVVTSVPFLHPSHPSIVEATAMATRPGRSESNQRKIKGGSATASTTGITKAASVDADTLPPGWEIRHSRTRDVYYYNSQTQESTWTLPVSSSTSTPPFSDSTRRRRGSSMSAGGRPPSPHKSDYHHQQELPRSGRGQAQLQPDFDITDPEKSTQEPATPSLASATALSYEDRHYRPGDADDNAPTAEDRRGERNSVNVDSRYNPQPQRGFTPPPASLRQSRERDRSPSPMVVVSHGPPRGRDSRPSRGSRPTRGGRDVHTDVGSSSHRERDTSSATFVPSRTWSQASSTDPTGVNSYQGSRRPQRQPPYQNADSPFDFGYEGRQPLSRNGSTRGRGRDREQPRVNSHENRNQDLSAPRTRSPPHLPDRETSYKPQYGLEQPQPTPTNVSTSTSNPDAPRPPQRKRERPSRFDRPSAPTLAPTLLNVEAPRRDEEDIYVPDDILSPQNRVEEPRRESVRNELTSSSEQIAPPTTDAPPSFYPNNRVRADDRAFDQDRGQSSSDPGRLSPASDSARRKREPLPPQAARFREMAIKPKHTPPSPRQVQSRPYAQYPPTEPLDSLLRDQSSRPTNLHNSLNNGLPSGPRYQPPARGELDQPRPISQGPDSNKEITDRHGKRRVSDSQPLAEGVMDTDIDDLPFVSSRTSPSPSTKNVNSEPSAHGMYGDRETSNVGDALPRAPRAMASKPPGLPGNGPSPTFHGSAPPITSFGPNSGGRGRDRSPPPHLQAHGPEGRREFDGYDRGQRRREPRPRPMNEFPRPLTSAPLKLSGTNSVPIGSGRIGGKGGGSNGPPGGLTTAARFNNPGPPAGISPANMEPLRNMRFHGAPPPGKEFYERPAYGEKPILDSYRPGNQENDGPHKRHREENIPNFNQRQLSPGVPIIRDPPRNRRETQYPGGGQNRFVHIPTRDEGRMPPRTWTPREPSPRDHVARANYSGGSDYHTATPPPVSRESSHVSPTWETSDRSSEREALRYHPENRAPKWPDNRSAPPKPDARPKQQHDDPLTYGTDRLAPATQTRRMDSLEGRLSERYDDRYPEGTRQSHGLPPNPALHRGHSPENRRTDHRGSFNPRFMNPTWGEPIDEAERPNNIPYPHIIDEPRLDRDSRNDRVSRQSRPRRPPMDVARPDDDPMNVDSDNFPHHPPGDLDPHHRPAMSRRGASLLDRLSLDHNGDSPGDQTLRDRVQVPSKRDREEFVGDTYPAVDSSFDGDDGSFGDPASKKARRRSGKPRKVRRGGGP